MATRYATSAVVLLMAAGLVWNLSAQEGTFEEPPVAPPTVAFPEPAIGTEPFAQPPRVEDPHQRAKRALIELNTQLIERMSPEEVQQAIDAVTAKLRSREADQKLERARALLTEIVREAPGTPAAARAQRGLNATGLIPVDEPYAPDYGTSSGYQIERIPRTTPDEEAAPPFRYRESFEPAE